MNIVDFFCGAGGASCGLQHSDFATVVAAVNHDPNAIAAHATNHPSTRHYNADITRLDPEELARNHPGDRRLLVERRVLPRWPAHPDPAQPNADWKRQDRCRCADPQGTLSFRHRHSQVTSP